MTDDHAPPVFEAMKVIIWKSPIFLTSVCLELFYTTRVIKTIQRIKWKPGFGKTNRPIPGSKNYHFQNEVDVQNLTYENEFYFA